MRQRRDYYKILGVPRSASPEQIKRAYRKLAKQYHPDRNPGDPKAEQHFKEVQQAYHVLSDPSRRADYDRFGEAGVGQWATGPHGQKVYRWGSSSSVNLDDLEDLLSAFGSGRGQRASVFDELFRGFGGGPAPVPQRGADRQRRVSLTLNQAWNGAVVSVRLADKRDGHSETLEVKIPPGVADGQKIRLAGQGQPGANGGPPGDLLLVCSIQPHSYYRRDGADLYLDVPVTVAEAALGAKIEVPTLDGRVTVTLPPGTGSGTKLRLKNRGLPKRGRSQRGDQYVVIQIEPPRARTEEQRRLLERLRDLDQTDPRSRCAWNQQKATQS